MIKLQIYNTIYHIYIIYIYDIYVHKFTGNKKIPEEILTLFSL